MGAGISGIWGYRNNPERPASAEANPVTCIYSTSAAESPAGGALQTRTQAIESASKLLLETGSHIKIRLLPVFVPNVGTSQIVQYKSNSFAFLVVPFPAHLRASPVPCVGQLPFSVYNVMTLKKYCMCQLHT